MKRIVGFKAVVMALVAGAALGQMPVKAQSDTPAFHIYLKNSSGAFVDACATSSYQEGQVYGIATGTVIGTVPSGSFYIYNANHQVIGYLSPDV